MNPVLRLTVKTGQLAFAIVMSFLFFVGISMLHAMIDLGLENDSDSKKANKVLIEMVRKPPEEEKKKPTSRIRKVTQESNDNKLGNRSGMKLVPDLTVDAGQSGGDGAEAMVQVDSKDLQVEVFEEGETDERPIPLHMTPVAYPFEARERQIQGKLVVYFIIGHDGKVKSIEVKKSPSPIITREAKRTIMKWRFKPGKKKGIPVNVRAKKEIDFVLQK